MVLLRQHWLGALNASPGTWANLSQELLCWVLATGSAASSTVYPCEGASAVLAQYLMRTVLRKLPLPLADSPCMARMMGGYWPACAAGHFSDLRSVLRSFWLGDTYWAFGPIFSQTWWGHSPFNGTEGGAEYLCSTSCPAFAPLALAPVCLVWPVSEGWVRIPALPPAGWVRCFLSLGHVFLICEHRDESPLWGSLGRWSEIRAVKGLDEAGQTHRVAALCVINCLTHRWLLSLGIPFVSLAPLGVLVLLAVVTVVTVHPSDLQGSHRVPLPPHWPRLHCLTCFVASLGFWAPVNLLYPIFFFLPGSSLVLWWKRTLCRVEVGVGDGWAVDRG